MQCPKCNAYGKRKLALNVAECRRCKTLYDPRTGQIVKMNENDDEKKGVT